MKQKSHRFRGLSNVFLALFVILLCASNIAMSWAEKVNELLGISGAVFERSANPEDYLYTSDYSDPMELVSDEVALNTRLEAEGAVALKGMPAIEGNRVSLFGMRSGAKMQFGGSMGALIESSQAVTLGAALEARGFFVNPALLSFYQEMEANYAPQRASGGNVVSEPTGAAIHEVPVSEYAAVDASTYADYSDAAIIVFGRDAGESCCFYVGADGILEPEEFEDSITGNVLGLSDDERDLVNYVKEQGFKKIVVLLNSGTSMEIEELKQDEAIDSIVWIGNPGAYGTYGIAQLLSGERLPSGHLPDTFAVNAAKAPSAQNFGVYLYANKDQIETTGNNGLRSDWFLVEEESIYIGYKYYETRFFDAMVGQGNAEAASAAQTADGGNAWNYDKEVSYSFGYGLEGSTFEEKITDTDIDWSGDKRSTVTVEVTNTGDTAAKHAVQLYVSAPYTDYDRENGIEKAAVQLIGYAKTGEASENSFADYVTLSPGETESVTIEFLATDFYSYDDGYEHDGVTGAYLLEEGDYCFATGNGAHDAVLAVLAATHPEIADLPASTGDCVVETVDDEIAFTESNDTLIQNRLQGGELNHYACGTEVTYLTRNDWNGTFPKGIREMTATEEMITLLRNQTYDAAAERAAYDGPETFTEEAGNDVQAVDLIGLDYDDEKFGQAIDNLSVQQLINQYIAFLEPIDSINMPKEQRADSPMGFIGKIGQYTQGSIYALEKDAEGYGIYTDVYVSGPVLAATFSPLLQKEEGRLIGNDALWTGYNAWFAPGLNIHRSPFNGRNVEYYSEDALLTGSTGAYVHQSLNRYGVMTNAKHFAFNDTETNRDGLSVYLSEQAARENELRGFQICFRDGGMKGVMTAFNRLGCTHVAADRDLMNGIVRGEWGFKGQIITDSVKSAAYFQPRETIMAANNEMLGGSNNGAVWNMTVDAVKADPVLWNALRESYHHKLYAYVNSNLLNGVTREISAVGGILIWVLALRIAMGILFALSVTFFILFIVHDRKERRQ